MAEKDPNNDYYTITLLPDQTAAPLPLFTPLNELFAACTLFPTKLSIGLKLSKSATLIVYKTKSYRNNSKKISGTKLY
jgi:hypothetical protein